jgi:hypothetical protein|tara:strand:+ start:122 stop:271 length:150 start_codon:yes stop_codon:yes gene_type:complete
MSHDGNTLRLEQIFNEVLDELIDQGMPSDSMATWDKATEITYKRLEESD